MQQFIPRLVIFLVCFYCTGMIRFFCNSLCSYCCDIHVVMHVVFCRGSEVPYICSLGVLCLPVFLDFTMYHHLCTWWVNWGLVIIKFYIEYFLC